MCGILQKMGAVSRAWTWAANTRTRLSTSALMSACEARGCSPRNWAIPRMHSFWGHIQRNDEVPLTWAPRARANTHAHTHTPGSYLASVYFVLVGDPVQKLFAHLDWRHCRQKLPVFFALRVQPPQQRHLQDQEKVRGFIRRPTRLKKSKEKSLKSVDDTLIKPSLAFWGVKVVSELKAPVFSDLSFFKNVLAWTTRKCKHQSGNNDCVNLITICFKRKKSHFQSEATFVPVTPSKLRDNVFSNLRLSKTNLLSSKADVGVNLLTCWISWAVLISAPELMTETVKP